MKASILHFTNGTFTRNGIGILLPTVHQRAVRHQPRPQRKIRPLLLNPGELLLRDAVLLRDLVPIRSGPIVRRLIAVLGQSVLVPVLLPFIGAAAVRGFFRLPLAVSSFSVSFL